MMLSLWWSLAAVPGPLFSCALMGKQPSSSSLPSPSEPSRAQGSSSGHQEMGGFSHYWGSDHFSEDQRICDCRCKPAVFSIVLADPPVHQHRRVWDISPLHSRWQGRFPQPLQAVGLCWGIWGGEKKSSETKVLVGVTQFHSFSCMDSDGQRFQGRQGCLGTN